MWCLLICRGQGAGGEESRDRREGAGALIVLEHQLYHHGADHERVGAEIDPVPEVSEVGARALHVDLLHLSVSNHMEA